MIVENHQIAHRNVASKYYRFAPEEIDAVFEDFDTILERNGLHTNGMILFSILSDPTEDLMTAEIFLGIEEDDCLIDPDEQVYFRSYFSIMPMIMTRITTDFDEQSQVQYWELLDYIKRHDGEQNTPVFIEYKQSYSGQSYMEMSVGV